MYSVDEQPETIHLYIVREKEPKPSLFPIFLSVFALSLLIAFCVLSPYQQPVTRITLRVPAVLLPMKTFSVQVAIIQTGIKTYPATTAHGILTFTNGSIIGQSIPAGFIVAAVMTDTAVYIPPGNANDYGYATVKAHALITGKGGNFATFTINQVIGSSVYIRNLSAFTGGRDAYSVKFITAEDRQTALAKARQLLTQESIGLHYPCKEDVLVRSNLQVMWVCQYVTYKIPTFMSVRRVRIVGKNLLIDVWFVVHPKRVWAK